MARIRAACSSRGHVPIGEDRGRALQPRHARFRFTMASDINTWQWRTKDGRRSDMTDGRVEPRAGGSEPPWQPFSKWQNPSYRIDQLFFCLSASSDSSLPDGIPLSRRCSPPTPHRHPISDASYWSLLVIGRAVIWDGHWRMSANCFSFCLPLLSRVMKS